MTSENRQIGQTGQTADAAMLRKDSGRQQTCLRHKEKTWGNSDPVPVSSAHSSAHFLLGLQHGWLKGAFVHWFLSVSTNQNITLRYFKLNVSRHHIERISLHRLYRLPRPFEVLVFSDGYGYCKDILQQASIESIVSMGPKFKGRRNEETCCLHLIYVMCLSTQPVYIIYIYIA